MKQHYLLRAALISFTLGILFLMAGRANAEVPIGLGGEMLFVLKSDNDLNKSAKDRSNDVYDRLRNILNNPNLKPKDIQVKPLENYGAKIIANGILIVPIGIQEAEAHGSKPMQLAEEWATHLRKILPKLRARPDIFKLNHSYVKRSKS